MQLLLRTFFLKQHSRSTKSICNFGVMMITAETLKADMWYFIKKIDHKHSHKLGMNHFLNV
jgi:hypothetical protein